MEVSLGKEVMSHHGQPVLFERDMVLLNAFSRWVQVVRAQSAHQCREGSKYPVDWLPNQIDMFKSRLFWRIRAGQPVLRHAPPTAMACPWYELIEELRPHWVSDVRVVTRAFDKPLMPPRISISGTSWFDMVERHGEDRYVVSFYPWTFDLFRSVQKQPVITAQGSDGGYREVLGWWLQRRPDSNERLYLDEGELPG